MTKVYQKSPEIIVDLPEERANNLPQTTDDLTNIKGIGSGIAEKLNTRKIFTYRQLTKLTPEKLSEAPGVSIAMARKFIEEAKNLLREFQEIEVAEVIVEEELPREKFQIEEKPSGTVQKQWFNDKFNRSRLTASYPPVLKRSSKEPKIEIEEIEEIEAETKTEPEVEENFEFSEPLQERSVTPYERLLARSDDKIENAIIELEENEPGVKNDVEEEAEDEYQEKVPEQIDIFNEESFVVEKPKPLEEDSREETSFVPEINEIFKVENVPKISKMRYEQEETKKKIEESLKNSGYYVIPNTLNILLPFFQNVDSIGSKLVGVNNNLKLIYLVPIKLCELEGTILVDEEKIGFKTYSKAQDSDSIRKVGRYMDELLKTKDAMIEDVVNSERIRDFFQEYLQIRFTAEKRRKSKKLFFVSGQTQYKILIEPILLTKIPAKCVEKSIIFPYQRKTNLHVIDRSNIANLLRFLEKKYQLIESCFKRTNSMQAYQSADTKFRSSLRRTSLPFLGYSIVLLFIYFSQFYFLLRLFNSIGFAVIGIYFFATAYFYFKFSKTKKKLKIEFKTPYYLQNLQFSETDLLYVKEEFTDEQMAQFGYECFGKDNNFKVLEQIEKNNIKESIVARQQERDVQQLYTLDSEPEYNSIKAKPKYETKYSSFFED